MVSSKTPQFDRSDKRTHEFITEIQSMIDNNPSRSNTSIARDMEVSELLIRKVGNENIWYFSYKMRKDQFFFFITVNERQRGRSCCKVFEQTQASPLTEHFLLSLKCEKNSTRIKWGTHKNNRGLELSLQNVSWY